MEPAAAAAAAAARPVRTKRPSRRAAEAAAAAAASSKKRPTRRIADADQQIQLVPAFVGAATEGGAASHSCRRRNPSSPRSPGAKKKTTTILRSHPPQTLDPCSNSRGGKKRQDILDDDVDPSADISNDCSNNRGGKRARSIDLPRPPPDSNNSRRGCANHILLDDRPAWLIADPCQGPPDNNNIWRDLANSLLDDAPAPKRPCPPPDSSNNWRDWANLSEGPAGLIAERVLAYDVADYVCYRAVCRPWRQCSTNPRSHSGLDRRFHPWRWTMLQEELTAPDRRCFLNTSTAKCVQVDIPELNDHLLLAVTAQGLLVLVRKTQRSTVRLLNPLTHHLTELPPLTTLVPPEHHDKLSQHNLEFNGEFKAWGSGISNDDSTVVLCFNRLGLVGLAKPGDDSWKLLVYRTNGMATAPLMFAGRFYCVNLSGVMVLEMSADQPPQLKVAAKLSMHVSPMADSLHLVNNCGELMLVHRRSRRVAARNKSGRGYTAYGVDLDTGTLLPVKSLGGSGGCAVFMGLYCSLSVPLGVFPSGSLSADTIYLSFNIRERMLLKARAYHLKDGRVEVPCSSLVPVPRPHTLIDCLSLVNTAKKC